MSVFVVGLNGCRLMPVSERKARLLLKGGKASVYRKVPFTIKLNYKTGSTVQPGYLGIDSGSQHIGVSVVRKDGTGRNRRTRSLPKDRQDGCRHPCSPKRAIISSGSGSSWTFSRKDTGFPSNWAVLTRPG